MRVARHWMNLPLFLVLNNSILLSVNGEKRTFLWFSDIHLDPYYGTEMAVSHNKLFDRTDCTSPEKPSTNPMGDFNCDTPEPLMNAVLEQAVSVTDPDFCIITGDFVRHNNDELPAPLEDTQSILETVSTALVQNFELDLPIVPSLGNNDVTPDYYFPFDDPDEMLSMVTAGLEPLLTRANATSAFQQGGYYAHNVSDQLTVLSLNTVLYSSNHQPSYDDADDTPDPLGQFSWLQQQLKWANDTQRNVYVVGHIPPSIGSYRHTQLWKDVYLEQYYRIVGPYTPLIKGQLFGHIHTEEFRVHGPFPLFLTSSFTPIYGSNPSFRVVTYDSDTSELLDYQVHYLDLASNTNNATWHTGELFTQAFGVPDMSWESLQSIVQDLQSSTDSRHWEALLTRQHAYSHGSEVCNAQCRREWACTLSSMTTPQYEACLGVSENAWSSTGIKIVVVVLMLGILVGGVRAIRRHCQRKHYQVPTELGLQETHCHEDKALPEMS